jgi:hypothetical protein
MKPPFIIDDAGDISIFWTLSETEKDLEPPDVGRTDCVVYDSEGRRLRIVLKSRLFLGPRVILRAPDPQEPVHAAALQRRLRDFLVAVGEPRDRIEDQSLDRLIATTVDRLKLDRR